MYVINISSVNKLSELIPAFANIPPSITSLHFSRVDWGKLNNCHINTSIDMTSALSIIPADVNELILSIGYTSGEALAQIFFAISPSVTYLNLRDNDLWKKRNINLDIGFSTLPSSITRLNLGANLFGQKNCINLEFLLKTIPSSVTALDLSSNGLGKLAYEDLVRNFKAISSKTKNLNLSFNEFYNMTSEELSLAFAALPSKIKSLNLSDNKFDKKTGSELAQAFATIPSGVTKLNLSNNKFHKKTGSELAQAFASIPSGVTELNLSDNHLKVKTGAELAEAFTALPCKIEFIDLRYNWLKDYQLLEICAAILLPRLQQYINNKDFTFAAIKLPIIKIEDHVEYTLSLNNVIEILEQKNTGLAYFTCGLLLSGIIEIPVDLTEKTHQARLEFIEHCEHSAISFYNQAYQLGDAQLKEFSNHCLWELRVTAQSESVRERLNSYDLHPSPSYMEGYNQSPWRKPTTKLPTYWLRKGFFIKAESPDEGSSSKAVPRIEYRR